MINTILAATDGSTHAARAVELAADLAGRYGARLVLMHVIGQGRIPDELAHMAEVEHVVDPPDPDPSTPRAAVAHGNAGRSAGEHRIHAFVGEKILQAAEKAARGKGAKDIRRVAAEGDAAALILATADEEHADMIVVGSRGLGSLKGLLVGSVSNKINHLAPCTCINVK